MNEAELSGVQKLAVGAVSPETAAEIEAQSRSWMIRCPHCGFERSVWDAGGVRYKAAGTPRQRMTCSNCGQTGWHKIHWAGAPGGGTMSPGSVAKLLMGIMAVSLIGAGLIVALVLWLTGVL